jgi:hypothetical protein
VTSEIVLGGKGISNPRPFSFDDKGVRGTAGECRKSSSSSKIGVVVAVEFCDIGRGGIVGVRPPKNELDPDPDAHSDDSSLEYENSGGSSSEKS